MSSDTLDHERPPVLGDEWRDWDGSAPPDASAPKRLFFALTAALVLCTAAGALGAFYLVAPRVAEWHALAPRVLLGALGAFVFGLAVALGLLALVVRAGWPRRAACAALAGRLLAAVEGGVFTLGGLVGIDRDRLAHAFIRTHNALLRLAPRPAPPERVLVLVPRCLRKAELAQVRAVAAARGVAVDVVAGGEQARQRLKERRPLAVVGVACERDLVSGIRDVRRRIPVVGITNTRPSGPCRDTRIALDELEAALDLCVGPAGPTAAAAPRDEGAP
jgi:hypothetical protein